MQKSRPDNTHYSANATKCKPRLVIFASGSKTGGGSGFENLVKSTYSQQRGEAPLLNADIVAVVSNHENGGVRKRAEKLAVPFIHFNPNRWSSDDHLFAEKYQEIVKSTGAQWIALSGWLKKVEGLDPSKTFNIHPALLSQLNGRFGGKGMWGHNVHEAVKEALEKGEIKETGVTMHFVTSEYDRGPIFFEHKVPLKSGMSAKQIAELVNTAEHKWQPIITNEIIHGNIRLQ